MPWGCHVYSYAKSRYDMIFGRYLLTSLRLNLKFYEYVIEAYYEPFKGSLSSMLDLGKYEFKDLDMGKLYLNK